nr:S8 family serine peptidase [Paenarthrobacter aurescens]
MKNQPRASVRSRLVFAGIIAMVGASMPAIPAVADDAQLRGAAPLAMSAGSEPIPTDQFIVKFKERAGIQSLDRQSALGRASNALGVAVTALRTTATGQEVLKTSRRLDADESAELVAALASDPNVEYAEPDAIMRPFAVAPDDKFYNLQWPHIPQTGGMNVLKAWDVSQGEGSVVAVIDSGIISHSDLNANILPGYDMLSFPAMAKDGDGRDPNPRDEGDANSYGQCGAGTPAAGDSWHGTHTAGIISAVAGNGIGVAGVAPKAKVVPIRALGVCGGYSSDVADAVIWAAGGAVPGVPANANPARAINISLGGRGQCTSLYQDAFDFARSKGVSVVISAGNERINASEVQPANCKSVLVVGASTRNGSKAWYSNFGVNVDVVAPGGDMFGQALNGVVSTQHSNDYFFKQGTSMSAPHVAAVAAMMYSKLPALTPDEVEQKLKATARPVSDCPGGCGGGLVDAGAALANVAADAAPMVPGTPTISGEAAVGGTLTMSPGTWGPAGYVVTEQRWNRNDVATNFTGTQYVLGPEDLGTTITVTVTGKKAKQPNVSVTSAPTQPVAIGKLTVDEPVIEGTPYVGGVLTADTGAWAPAPVELAVEWLRDGAPIQGATGQTHTATESDLGKAITLRVSGSKPGYQPQSLVSKPTGLVVAADKAVTPEPVVFTDAPYTEDDTYVIPDVVGINYVVDGGTVASGNHPATGRVTVTAVAKDGYVLLPGATAWTERFSAKGPDFVPPTESPFKDVLTTQQFYREMAWLADKRISTGWVEADKTLTYRPLTPINRDAMAAFLYRLSGSPAYTPPANSPFKDVLTTQQFYKEMAWLADQKISSGWTESDGSRTYRPLTPINRDAMAAFLYRLSGSPQIDNMDLMPFKDVVPGQQFSYEMAWMSEMEISSGWIDTDGSRVYKPITPINRDAMAAFLYRMP